MKTLCTNSHAMVVCFAVKFIVQVMSYFNVTIIIIYSPLNYKPLD